MTAKRMTALLACLLLPSILLLSLSRWLTATRLAALLTPGGWVALADLEHDADGGFHRHVHGFSGHHGFSREDLGRWLTAAGLVEVTVGDAGFDVKEVEGEERRFPLLLAAGRRPSP